MTILTDPTNIFAMTDQIVKNANETSTSSSTENQGGGSIISTIIFMAIFSGVAFFVVNMMVSAMTEKANEISAFLEQNGTTSSHSSTFDNEITQTPTPITPKPVEDKFGNMN